MVKRALLSVYDKSGIVEFAQGLTEMGWEIISTGGTARALQGAGVPVIPIKEITGLPEILDGRVKTLHPTIYAALLARREDPSHLQTLAQMGIVPIDLVAVNLYPFEETVAGREVELGEALENIDIGGPAMIRAAAKNFPSVAVAVNPSRYTDILRAFREEGNLSQEFRLLLAHEAFQHTAFYDSVIDSYFKTLRREKVDRGFPEELVVSYRKTEELRYGENPHQKAAFYRDVLDQEMGIAQARQWQGKKLSYNNINDADAALRLIKEFNEPACVVIKHTNPCGVAIGEDLDTAYAKAYAADPISIFGGIVAFNRTVDEKLAKELNKIFLEIVLAPGYETKALEVFAKKPNLRVLEVDLSEPEEKTYEMKKVLGGLLVQEEDNIKEKGSSWRVITEKKPGEKMWPDFRFAWQVVKHVKSNAIVLVKDGQTLGVGAGQMNRIDAARLAIEHAKKVLPGSLEGAVLASDAFFPFPDVVEEAVKAGVKGIIQPGGSIKDEESIKAANDKGIAMVFTSVRHFRH